jgi:hypothetical protein
VPIHLVEVVGAVAQPQQCCLLRLNLVMAGLRPLDLRFEVHQDTRTTWLIEVTARRYASAPASSQRRTVCRWADLTAWIGFRPNVKPLQRHKGVLQRSADVTHRHFGGGAVSADRRLCTMSPMMVLIATRT